MTCIQNQRKGYRIRMDRRGELKGYNEEVKNGNNNSNYCKLGLKKEVCVFACKIECPKCKFYRFRNKMKKRKMVMRII